MKYNEYGHVITTSNDLCRFLYKDPNLDLSKFLVEDTELFNNSINAMHYDTKKLNPFVPLNESIEDFDKHQQSTWYMPPEYLNLDIVKWVLEQCKTNEELERVEQELLLYQERGLFSLLKYLKYLVDTMRSNNVVWGVGRGSSTASYVLYVIGVHKINSIKYNLDVTEFLK